MNRGLIIGGPMDGKLLEYKGEVWDYHKTPESLSGPIDYSNMDAAKAALNATSEVGRYYYTDMTYLGAGGHSTGRRIGFWVQQDQTLDDALTAVLTRYQEPRKEKTLLKRAGDLIYRLLRAANRLNETDFREARDTMDQIRRLTDEG